MGDLSVASFWHDDSNQEWKEMVGMGLRDRFGLGGEYGCGDGG